MNIRKSFLTAAAIALLAIPTNLSAASFFTANAGGRLNYSSVQDSETYNPTLSMEAFIESQFNFSETLWSHLNFSLKTHDFLQNKLFSTTEADFRIDEISLISSAKIENSTNYIGIYMGSFDPVGSDFFFQRYFGQQPIASKLTESWLGKASSILYPHFGIGVSDVLKFNKNPMAIGIYAYFNNEDDKFYVFNTDFRYACVYRYFSLDIAGGLGIPLSDKYNGSDAIVVVDTVYWHAGATMLIGNNYTQSLFIQGGLFNASFTKKDSSILASPNDFYILVEPRFRIKNTHLNFTVYSLPQQTVDQLLFVKDTLGCNINIYNDTLSWGTKKVCVGTNFALSFPTRTFMDVTAIPEDIMTMKFNGFVTPYFSTTILSGQLHGQVTIEVMDFFRNNWQNAFSVDLGFRTSL